MYEAYKTLMSFLSKITIGAIALSLSVAYAHSTPQGAYADKYAAIVIDANTGQTLFDVNSNARRYPASLTKMMTLYLLFEAMQAGRVSPNTPIPVSAYAAAQPPTKIGFRAGQTIPAELAAKALITKSANDVATAIGEYLGGSEERFAQIMTAKARRLGMMNTNFANASGLPDVNNYSTARDLAILSLALREHFPRQYEWFKTTSFQFRGQTINGHNHLVKNMDGVDGIKTGYTKMSGSNLATSMRMNGRSIVAVVMGGRSSALRDAHMAELLRRYLPQASRSKARAPLIAATQYDLPHDNAPIPVLKNAPSEQQNDATQDKSTVMVAALANETTSTKPAVSEINKAVVSDSATKTVAPVETPKESAQEKIDPVVTSSAPTNTRTKQSGWTIQIGSLPNQEQANTMLANAARAAGNRVLASATPSTQVTAKHGQQYYRARFVGFPTKKAALDACTVLKKANFNCYALSQ